MRVTRKRAAEQGKESVWLIKFPGFVVEARIVPDRDHLVEE